ncbi:MULTISPECIES: 5-methylcytosine restriction system specificity protein McrC [Nocardia]|uniref:Restriction endonuclease n=2 Tax=Nocardia TaxID=1817 RepID=A0A2T2YQA5_9NOCA|nr:MULTISPECIES: hypothetical protein [Nocardia]PSR57694.1 hypothetical protein C8259_33580 [Nocardia nova]
MTERLVFRDLAGADRALTENDRNWLQALARDTDPANFVVGVGTSRIASAPEPVLHCDPDGNWRAGRYIGELHRDGRVLEIRPRLGFTTIAAWAGAALNVRIVPRTGDHSRSSILIAELLAATWRSTLVDATRHGLPGFRAPQQHISPYVRGRLDLPSTMTLRTARSPHVASTSRPKQFDNPVSAVIVLADRVLDRALRRKDWRGHRIDEVMPRLRAVTGPRPKLPTLRELRDVRYTPITLPYRRVAELSWQIARRNGLRAAATSERTTGLLIDVAELWELFLLHCAKRAFGTANVTHGTRLTSTQYLLRTVADPMRTLGNMYPDLILGPPSRPWAIVDAKYKPLTDPRGVDREDLYQLHAYLSAHLERPLPAGALAYVDFPEPHIPARAETMGPWKTSNGHQVRFQRLPITENECVRAFQQLIQLSLRDDHD